MDTDGGEIRYDRWFTGKKISSFYGIEYVNKYSGLRFKLDFDKSNPFQFDKEQPKFWNASSRI